MTICQQNSFKKVFAKQEQSEYKEIFGPGS